MHGLIFETSVCYWQNQPGCYLEVSDLSSTSDTIGFKDFDITLTPAVLCINARRHSDSHPLKRKRAHGQSRAGKHDLDTTNSLLPSLSSILKRRRRYHARSAGGYYSSTYSNRMSQPEVYGINDLSSILPALREAQSGMTSLLFGGQRNRRG